MTSTDEMKALENNIKHNTAVLELGYSLERLRINKDFQKVVLKGYFEQEAVRLVLLKADANMQPVAHQESIVKQIDAIGALSGYFNTVRHLASMAERSIESDGATLEDMLAEEGGAV